MNSELAPIPNSGIDAATPSPPPAELAGVEVQSLSTDPMNNSTGGHNNPAFEARMDELLNFAYSTEPVVETLEESEHAPGEVVPVDKAEDMGGNAHEETEQDQPASEATKNTILNLLQTLTNDVPAQKSGLNDSLEVKKERTIIEPGWGDLIVSTFPYRTKYSQRGAAEVEVVKQEPDGSQKLLRVALDGLPGSLKARIAEYELNPSQANQGVRPESFSNFVESTIGRPAGELTQQERVDLALGTYNLPPVRNNQLTENEARKIIEALSNLESSKLG
jgi:hypothetical protein